MKNKGILLVVFILVALVQLYIPAKMISDKNDVLETGTEFKFRTAPLDPEDPFRGKYITLTYRENTIRIDDPYNWSPGETAYVLIGTDPEGFARLDSVRKDPPMGNADFIQVELRTVTDLTLTLDFPFDRFYMEETKAPRAEEAYFEAQQDSSQVTYALVNVKDGDAVLKDVVINGVSVRDLTVIQ